MTETPSTDVLIIGAGLAGLSAAEALSQMDPALKITVLEARRRAGGRAGSFDDPSGEEPIDYCQHVAMGCCTNFLDLTSRTGLSEHFRRYRELTFLHPNHPASRFAPGRWLPAPLHLAGALSGQRYLSRRQQREIRRGMWKLMRSRDSDLGGVTASDWLAANGQSAETLADFWGVFLVSALGETPDRVTMSAARKVMIDGFAAARGVSDVFVPTRPLSELFGETLVARLRDRGVDLVSSAVVRAVLPDQTVLTESQRYRCRHVIVAVPWHQLVRIFDRWEGSDRDSLPDLEQIASFPASPITGIHLWFDRPITELDHAVMVGTAAEWLFRNPIRGRTGATDSSAKDSGEHYHQVVISGSHDVRQLPKDQLIARVQAELRHAFPIARAAELLRWRIVTDPKSVFSIRPEVDAARPESATALPWLHLAGDWTQTGWPATMEGAVISGRQAAAGVRGQPKDAFVSDPPQRGWLARLLIR